MWPKTEKQSRLLNIAREISQYISTTASYHDRHGTFPHDNFRMMTDKGYISATVPEEYGGSGHGLTDIALPKNLEKYLDSIIYNPEYRDYI